MEKAVKIDILSMADQTAAQRRHPTASPAQRVAVGSEEQQKERAMSFARNEKARRKRYDACDELVRLEGFEPATFWFVAKHSIQLSYSRNSFPQGALP